MAASFTITLDNNPNPEDWRLVDNGLRSFNLEHAPDDLCQRLAVFLRNRDGAIVGGLLGETYWGWLHIDVLWLSDSVRRLRFGSKLLAEAEAEALRRGCRHAHLETMSFQAQGFYEQHGYSVFAILDDLPAGHQRIYMKKDLA